MTRKCPLTKILFWVSLCSAQSLSSALIIKWNVNIIVWIKKRLRAERSSLRVRHPHLTTKNRASNLIYIRKLTLCYLCADELASRLCLHSFAKVVIFFWFANSFWDFCEITSTLSDSRCCQGLRWRGGPLWRGLGWIRVLGRRLASRVFRVGGLSG